ncbi:MAG: GtrA family protein [Bacteroidales bacterium]|nr:GtrA family protein [Bacteroidales bacterium]
MKRIEQLNQIFKGKTGNVYVQLFRYLLSGGTAFLMDIGLMILLKEVFGVHYLTASIIGFIVGLIFTYILSIRWIFDERRLANKWNELAIFALIGVVGIGLTWFFMKLFTSILLLYYVFSKVLTTVIVSLWNFGAKKLILFTKKT